MHLRQKAEQHRYCIQLVNAPEKVVVAHGFRPMDKLIAFYDVRFHAKQKGQIEEHYDNVLAIPAADVKAIWREDIPWKGDPSVIGPTSGS